jgi:hypothetical protein
MTDFKVGDKVVRIKKDNGEHGACIGTIATVISILEGDGFIGVHYPGCFDDGHGDGSETWYTSFAELFQEPQEDKEEKQMNTMTLRDAYLALQEASGIKAGDTVRVLRKAGDFEMGWGQVWGPDMDKCVGESVVVESNDASAGFCARSSNGFCYWLPFFVLEKVAIRYITINGFEVPEPVREPLKMGEEYWMVALGSLNHCLTNIWGDNEADYRRLKRGLIHKTQEAAEKHAQALLSFTEVK